jgi:hypothetical protein
MGYRTDTGARAMLTYPKWFTALDRARIDRALAKHKPPLEITHARDLILLLPRYASDTAAIHAVLRVCDVVVQVLSRHRDRQPAEVLRLEAENLRDQLVVWADTYTPSGGMTLDAFTAAVRAETEAQSWWPSVAATREDVPAAALEGPRKTWTKRCAGQCPRQAEWLKREMWLAGDITERGLEALGGPDHHTTTRLLEGYGTDRDEVLHKVLLGLNDANTRAGRNVRLTIYHIPQD